MILPILSSVFLVSAISLVGVFFLAVKERTLEDFLEIFISFACGTLLGDAFIHVLPEALAKLGEQTFLLTAISFVFFFALEKFFYWRHCHDEHCQTHPFTYLNLIGDTIHNFIDGTIIAAVYLVSFSLGVSTTLAVVFHEIPQEVGDFSVLVFGGMKKKTAIKLNFFSALAAILGALFVYLFSQKVTSLTPYFLPFAAANFIYLAGTDIIPELHEKGKHSFKNSVLQFLTLSMGIVLMWLFKIYLA